MSGLDQAIIRLALAEARSRMQRGDLPQDAVAAATPGVWRQYRMEVLSILLDDCIDKDNGRIQMNERPAAPDLTETEPD